MYRNVLATAVTSQLARVIGEIASCIVNLHGKITVMNVIEVPYHLPYMYADEQLDEANRLAAEIRDVIDKSTAPTIKVERQVVIAREPGEVIVREAREKKYDLIFLGASSRKFGEKLLFGDIVDYVLQHSPCDVLVVSNFGKRKLQFNKILLTTTGFEHSRKAIQIAEALAKWHEETIIETFLVGRRKTEERKNESIVNRIKNIFTREHIKSIAKVVFGPDPADMIIKEARRGHHSLILMSAAEKPPGYRYLLGSVIDKVVRNAPCQVVVIKTVEP